MASTPSASALSAVLRCQGNILARKQASNKRPPSAAAVVYGLGTTCGDAFKSYFRSLWGFIFHRERVEIPGVLSVTARIETSCLGKPSIRYGGSKDHLAKNSVVTGNKVANQWSKTSLKFNPKPFSVLSPNNLVLRLTYLRKLNFEHPWTCCLCVVCVEKSSLKHGKTNSLFSLGLLWFLRDELIHLTTAVSGCLRTQLGIDWNQIHPDCDELSGCVKCASEHHHEDQRPLEGAEPGD